MANPLGLAADVIDLGHDLGGPLYGGCVSQLHIDEQVTFILEGNEALGRFDHAKISQE